VGDGGWKWKDKDKEHNDREKCQRQGYGEFFEEPLMLKIQRHALQIADCRLPILQSAICNKKSELL
jgi:hypothetical protein